MPLNRIKNFRPQEIFKGNIVRRLSVAAGLRDCGSGSSSSSSSSKWQGSKSDYTITTYIVGTYIRPGLDGIGSLKMTWIPIHR